MAKVTVTFDFDDGDQDQVLDWMNGWRYRAALSELDNQLRIKEKYGDDEPIKPSEVRSMLRDATEDLPIW